MRGASSIVIGRGPFIYNVAYMYNSLCYNYNIIIIIYIYMYYIHIWYPSHGSCVYVYIYDAEAWRVRNAAVDETISELISCSVF